MKDLLPGAAGGTLSVAAMVTAITTLRHNLLTTEQLDCATTHPEKFVERAAAMGGVDELPHSRSVAPVAGGLTMAGGLDQLRKL